MNDLARRIAKAIMEDFCVRDGYGDYASEDDIMDTILEEFKAKENSCDSSAVLP